MRQRELLVGIAAILGLTPLLAAQSAQSDCAKLELSAGKDRIEVRVPLRTYHDFLNDTKNYKAGEACFSLRADGNVEFELRLDANLGPIIADVKEDAGIGEGVTVAWLASALVDNAPTGVPHYEVLNRPQNVRRTVVLPYNIELVERWLTEGRWLPHDDRGPIVTATLTRLSAGACYMWATVSGDVNETYFGDVAYYNVFEEGVKEGAAAGTYMDPGMLEALEGMMEWAAELQAEGGPAEDVADFDLDKTPAEVGDWVEEFRTWSGENVGSDNFGLALGDVKFGATGLGALGAGFHLAVSGRIPTPKFGPLPGKISILVEPSVVTAGTPGSDLFVWKPGQGGEMKVTLHLDKDSPILRGTVRAELKVEKPYDPNLQEIEVLATFRALQGATSCQ